MTYKLFINLCCYGHLSRESVLNNFRHFVTWNLLQICSNLFSWIFGKCQRHHSLIAINRIFAGTRWFSKSCYRTWHRTFCSSIYCSLKPHQKLHQENRHHVSLLKKCQGIQNYTRTALRTSVNTKQTYGVINLDLKFSNQIRVIHTEDVRRDTIVSVYSRKT